VGGERRRQQQQQQQPQRVHRCILNTIARREDPHRPREKKHKLNVDMPRDIGVASTPTVYNKRLVNFLDDRDTTTREVVTTELSFYHVGIVSDPSPDGGWNDF
jgi:hypothetical protein